MTKVNKTIETLSDIALNDLATSIANPAPNPLATVETIETNKVSKYAKSDSDLIAMLDASKNSRSLTEFKTLSKTETGDHILTSVESAISKGKNPTVRLIFNHAFIADYAIHDFLRMSSQYNFEASLNRLKYLGKAIGIDLSKLDVFMKDGCENKLNPAGVAEQYIFDMADYGYDENLFREAKDKMYKQVNVEGYSLTYLKGGVNGDEIDGFGRITVDGRVEAHIFLASRVKAQCKEMLPNLLTATFLPYVNSKVHITVDTEKQGKNKGRLKIVNYAQAEM